jgi:hypothetical protein
MDVTGLTEYYGKAKGQAVAGRLARALGKAADKYGVPRWACLGYAPTVLQDRIQLLVMPAPMGVMPFMGRSVLVDTEALPFTNGSIRHWLLLHSLEDLGDPLGTLKECWRTLEPEGTLTVIVPHRYGCPPWIGKRTYTKLGLRDVLEQADLMVLGTVTLTGLLSPIGLGGLLCMTAQKQIILPIRGGGVKSATKPRMRPVPPFAQPC